MRVQNDNNGKSSYWVINPDAKPGKASRRRSCSIDGPPKDKKGRRSKKLHQSTDDISALSPNAMKLKHQNRSFDNLLSVASPCSSTDSLSNLDDFSNDLMYPYNGDSFARPRSTSNVSNVSSISGRMTPTQLDIDDLDTSTLVVSGGAEETANMVESMSIDGQHRNIASTINLNDSLKIVNNGNNQEMSPARQHSDSFGSADSGYESPAYYQSQQQQNRNTMGKLASPVPSKPPPPYNQPFGGQMNRQQQQPMFAGRMNFYSPQQQQQQQNRMVHVNNHHAPRLTHLPIQSQPTFPQQHPASLQQYAQQHNPNPFGGNVQQMNPGHGFDNFMVTTNASIIAPNVTMDSKINMASQFQQQHHNQMRKTASQNINGFGANMMDIPDDLHQVKLCGFADQQQLASDLDAIIRNELRDSSRNLQGICGPVSNSNDSNNNSNPLNIQTSTAFPLTGQNWVR